jgi:hypothetical protein
MTTAKFKVILINKPLGARKALVFHKGRGYCDEMGLIGREVFAIGSARLLRKGAWQSHALVIAHEAYAGHPGLDAAVASAPALDAGDFLPMRPDLGQRVMISLAGDGIGSAQQPPTNGDAAADTRAEDHGEDAAAAPSRASDS